MYPIKGFNPHTFIDWEGKLACVIYLPGCNFRCPFCHSSDLVLNFNSMPDIPFETIEEFFKSKKSWIDGVIIGGGEPTLYSGLPLLLADIKNKGLLVKLDTNGTNPKMLKQIINKSIVDYIAMDVKAPLEKNKYQELTASKVDIAALKESIDLLMNENIDYEFRTTVIPQYLMLDDILNIARTIKGAKKYVLQQFDPKHTLDIKMNKIKPYLPDELKKYAQEAKEFVTNCFIRGI